MLLDVFYVFSVRYFDIAVRWAPKLGHFYVFVGVSLIATIMVECILYFYFSFHSLIMKTPHFDASTIKHLLKKQKIATLDELKTALGTHAPATVFRKLGELSYRTSYSHGARYYTLDDLARFNNDGLWSYDSVWFSRYGTLLSTLEGFIDNAEAGHYGAELRDSLHVEVNPSLLKLINQGRAVREKVHGLYLYCSVDRPIHQRQLATREARGASEGTRGIIVSKDWVSDEIKAAIILFFSLLDEKQRRLFAGLESLQFGHGGDSWIADLLGLDPHTVSKGRRQIIERDILPEGLRQAGAGRPRVKKTPRK